MSLDEISLTIAICRTCGTLLISTKDKRMEFTEKEKRTINQIANITGKTVRWHRRSIPDWAHCHLE